MGAVGIELLELIRTLQTRRLLILRSDKREQNRKNAAIGTKLDPNCCFVFVRVPIHSIRQLHHAGLCRPLLEICAFVTARRKIARQIDSRWPENALPG